MDAEAMVEEGWNVRSEKSRRRTSREEEGFEQVASLWRSPTSSKSEPEIESVDQQRKPESTEREIELTSIPVIEAETEPDAVSFPAVLSSTCRATASPDASAGSAAFLFHFRSTPLSPGTSLTPTISIGPSASSAFLHSPLNASFSFLLIPFLGHLLHLVPLFSSRYQSSTTPSSLHFAPPAVRFDSFPSVRTASSMKALRAALRMLIRALSVVMVAGGSCSSEKRRAPEV
jgi:hypothetical protein